MPFPLAAFFSLSLAVVTGLSSAFSPALADAPPVAAPRTPVTVGPLPPVQSPAPAVVAPPKPAPVVTVAAATAKPVWRQPYLYALVALVDTVAASAATVMFMRRQTKGMMRLAFALTASSAVFIALAVVAWLT